MKSSVGLILGCISVRLALIFRLISFRLTAFPTFFLQIIRHENVADLSAEHRQQIYGLQKTFLSEKPFESLVLFYAICLSHLGSFISFYFGYSPVNNTIFSKRIHYIP